MKKLLSVVLVTVLLSAGLFILTGCNNSNDNSNDKAENTSSAKQTVSPEGTYKGQYTKYVGDTKKVEDEEFSLVLNADGTGTHNRDDSSFNVTWSLDGDNFKMSETFLGDPIEYTGTLVDGKLDIFNGDKSDSLTCEYVYEKQ